MFKECSVPKEIKLHKDKVAYSIVYGIAPYFKDLLKASTLVFMSFNFWGVLALYLDLVMEDDIIIILIIIIRLQFNMLACVIYTT